MRDALLAQDHRAGSDYAPSGKARGKKGQNLRYEDRRNVIFFSMQEVVFFWI